MATTERERHFWRRKLPMGFSLYLERLGRCVVRDQPKNIYEYAAQYMEDLVLEHEGNKVKNGVFKSVHVIKFGTYCKFGNFREGFIFAKLRRCGVSQKKRNHRETEKLFVLN